MSSTGLTVVRRFTDPHAHCLRALHPHADSADVLADHRMDNVYRIVKGPDSTFSQGLRGHWESQDTFVVESITLGQIGESTVRIQFSEDAIHVIVQEKGSGNTVEVQGTVSPAVK